MAEKQQTKAERRKAAEDNWNGPVQDAIVEHDKALEEKQGGSK